MQFGFAMGRLTTLVSLMSMYSLNALFLPRVRPFVYRNNTGTLLQCVMILGSAFATPTWVAPVLWVASYVTLFVSTMFVFGVCGKKVVNGVRIAVPIDVGHMAERFGYVNNTPTDIILCS